MRNKFDSFGRYLSNGAIDKNLGLSIHRKFYCDSKSKHLYDLIHAQTLWEERTIKMFGKEVMQPRLMRWMGDSKTIYKYSETTFYPVAWSPLLKGVKDEMSQFLDADFNSALINLYRNGKDSMGAHSDNEKELGSKPVIASLSLGAARRFVLRHIKSKEKVSVNLHSGDLLVMYDDTQTFWKHELPKTKSGVGPRINVTFRKIQSFGD